MSIAAGIFEFQIRQLILHSLPTCVERRDVISSHASAGKLKLVARTGTDTHSHWHKNYYPFEESIRPVIRQEIAHRKSIWCTNRNGWVYIRMPMHVPDVMDRLDYCSLFFWLILHDSFSMWSSASCPASWCLLFVTIVLHYLWVGSVLECPLCRSRSLMCRKWSLRLVEKQPAYHIPLHTLTDWQTHSSFRNEKERMSPCEGVPTRKRCREWVEKEIWPEAWGSKGEASEGET